MAPLTSTLQPITKMILLGDSGTGKTGALASLVKAGYKLRVLDLDNKLASGILPHIIKRECPDKMANVDFEARRDKFKSSSLGPVFDGIPRAFSDALALLDKWTDGTRPAEWGPDYIFVLDSLTFLADSAYNWAKAMAPAAKEPRQWFYTAQQAVENTISMLTADSFRTNVIVIAHVSWDSRPDGTLKGYPATIGKALGPTVPAYFDSVALCQTGAGNKRTIQTIPTALVDLKNPGTYDMPPTLPLETGLATFFEVLRK